VSPWPVKGALMTEMPDVLQPVRKLGIVTVTYNAARFLLPFLDCVLAQTHGNYELLVIDNASSDGTPDLVSSKADSRFGLLRNAHNTGYAAACNQGIRYFLACGVHDILLINNDTVFGSELFSTLQELLVRHAADAVTPRIVYADQPDTNWYAGGRFSFRKGFQGEHMGMGRLHDPADIRPRWSPVAPGCCVMFPAATFERIGGFDENYFVYFEDTDYFLRMQRAGLRLLYAPGVAIAHKISLSTGGPQSDFSIRYYQRNQIYLLRKHFGKIVVAVQLVPVVMKATFRFLSRRDSMRKYALRLISIGEGLRMPVRADFARGDEATWVAGTRGDS